MVFAAGSYFQSAENVQATAISWKSNFDSCSLCFGSVVAQPVGQPRQAALLQLLALTGSATRTCVSYVF